MPDRVDEIRRATGGEDQANLLVLQINRRGWFLPRALLGIHKLAQDGFGQRTQMLLKKSRIQQRQSAIYAFKRLRRA